MKKFVNKIPIWLLVVWPYIFFVGMLFPEGNFFGIYCVLTIGLCGANIMNACKYNGEYKARDLGFWGMLIKLVHMPFNIMVVMFAIILLVTMSATTGMQDGIYAIVFLIICEFIFMITSSVYCMKAAIAGKELGVIKNETANILGISCFIMISDIICAVIIYSKIKKNKKVKKI